MARRSESQSTSTLIRLARAVLNDVDHQTGVANPAVIVVRRLLEEIENPKKRAVRAQAQIDAWSRLSDGFFAADDDGVSEQQCRSHQLSRLAALYEKLNQTNGIGAIYTPPWMATLMAQRALSSKLAATLEVNAKQFEALFDNKKDTHARSIATAIGLDPDVFDRLRVDAVEVLRGLSITDPACGCGALLLAIAECAAALCEDVDVLDLSWRKTFIRNLSGFDIDPLAGEITRARLAAWAAVDRNDPALANIACRDALNAGGATRRADICIMNPPYVPTYSRRSDPRVTATVNHYAESHELTGRLNLFGCFIHRAIEMTKADGVVCAIVPDTFASATAYEPLRAAWRQRFKQSHWLAISSNVFDAQVGSVVVTAGPATQEKGELRADELIAVEPVQLSERVPAIATDGRVLMFRNCAEQRIWQAVQNQPARFEDFVRSRDGVNTGPRSMRDVLLDPQHVGPTVMPLIEGEDVAPQGYCLRQPRRRIDYNASLIDAAARRAGTSLRDPEIFQQPKVVSRQTADTLIAAVEPTGGIVALNSVHCHQMIDASDQSLWGLCAWLNAPLVRLYYALDGGEQRKVLPQVRIAWLRQLPVPRDILLALCELAPIARRLAMNNPSMQSEIDRIHTLTCAAYGLSDSSEAVLAAYRDRFPRFAVAPSATNATPGVSAA